MQYLTVSRFEGVYVICEDHEKRLFAIERNEAPEGLKEGDIIQISDDGTVCVAPEDAKRTRNQNNRGKSAAFRK
jgi:hypothetical protein